MLAAQQVASWRRRAVLQELDDAPAALLGAEHASVRGNGDTVRAAGDLAEDLRHAGARIEAQDALFLHGAEEHRGAVPRETARPPLERPSDQMEFPVHSESLSGTARQQR